MKDLKDLIPHREPFLFVDRVLEQSENTIKAERVVKDDEFYFKGHYPGNPILPGVLLCEAMFQAGAILDVINCRPFNGWCAGSYSSR